MRTSLTAEDFAAAQRDALAQAGKMARQVGSVDPIRWDLYLAVVRTDRGELPRDWAKAGPIPDAYPLVWHARSYLFRRGRRLYAAEWTDAQKAEGFRLVHLALGDRGLGFLWERCILGEACTHLIRPLTPDEILEAGGIGS
jgi:hypothetical protein